MTPGKEKNLSKDQETSVSSCHPYPIWLPPAVNVLIVQIRAYYLTAVKWQEPKGSEQPERSSMAKRLMCLLG